MEKPICFQTRLPGCEAEGRYHYTVRSRLLHAQGKLFCVSLPTHPLYQYFDRCCFGNYWSISAVAAAQLLRQFDIHLARRHFFSQHWYQLGTLYGLIASSFVIVLNIQAFVAVLWVVATKWLIIGRRKEGPCAVVEIVRDGAATAAIALSSQAPRPLLSSTNNKAILLQRPIEQQQKLEYSAR